MDNSRSVNPASKSQVRASSAAYHARTVSRTCRRLVTTVVDGSPVTDTLYELTWMGVEHEPPRACKEQLYTYNRRFPVVSVGLTTSTEATIASPCTTKLFSVGERCPSGRSTALTGCGRVFLSQVYKNTSCAATSTDYGTTSPKQS